jgi:alanyl-tRNA synthetase
MSDFIYLFILLRCFRDLIQRQVPVHTEHIPTEKAMQIRGLRALFGEKYGDVVRVVALGTSVENILNDPSHDGWTRLSIELCGGTHLHECTVSTSKGVWNLVSLV